MHRNKLNITDAAKRAQAEERITRRKAPELFEKGLLDSFEVGTFGGLATIHKYLFADIDHFAGRICTENTAKGNSRFAPMLYFAQALEQIDRMPHRERISAMHPAISSFDGMSEVEIPQINLQNPNKAGKSRFLTPFQRKIGLARCFGFSYTREVAESGIRRKGH